MPHAHHLAFESLPVTAVLIATVLVYANGWLRLRRLHPGTVKAWHAASFAVGLVFIWIAVASPLAALDHEWLTVHMVQHLLLMTLAPPLIWLGAPVKPLLYGLPQPLVEVVIIPLSCSAPIRQLGRALAHPAVCWLAAAGTLIAWHIPQVFMAGLQSSSWHVIEQTSFLVAGLLFWWPVVLQRPSASRSKEWTILLYLFLATLPCDILSGFLVFCDRVVYPIYFSSPRPLGLSALEDQQCAGALMWTCVTVVFLIAGAIFTARLLSPQGQREHRIAPLDSPDSAALHTVPQRMETL